MGRPGETWDALFFCVPADAVMLGQVCRYEVLIRVVFSILWSGCVVDRDVLAGKPGGWIS